MKTFASSLIVVSLFSSLVLGGQSQLRDGRQGQSISNKQYDLRLNTISQGAFKDFQKEVFSDNTEGIDYFFLKLQRQKNFKSIEAIDLEIFNFEKLTNKVVAFLNKLNTSYKLPINQKLRQNMQLEFYSLSQAIKKANEVNIVVQSEHYDKLHDMLMSQGTSLFYSSYKDKYKSDLFFASYYLSELDFPMDLTAKHISSVQKKAGADKFNHYFSKLAQVSLAGGHQLNKLSSDMLDVIYNSALFSIQSDKKELEIQKNYLKQLQLLGDQEKIKAVKRSLASSILWSETKKLFRQPWSLLKYIQYCVGYVFVAWPLEVLVVIVSIVIFGFQSSTVLTDDEKKNSSYGKRLWLMFVKSYMGSNVPFFSKLAASLVLFGIGLYFNSAKNFVESMIANM